MCYANFNKGWGVGGGRDTNYSEDAFSYSAKTPPFSIENSLEVQQKEGAWTKRKENTKSSLKKASPIR